MLGIFETMRHPIQFYLGLFLILCIASIANAQFPLHYRIDNTGKLQLYPITGNPFKMSVYRSEDALTLLKTDSSCTLTCSKYSFDRNFNRFRDAPSDVSSEPCAHYDFSQNIEIGKSYFTYAYPLWEDHYNTLFQADVVEGKYIYEYRYVHYTPEKSTSMPPPGPVSRIPARYMPMHIKWLLDSSYRISEIVVKTKDSNTQLVDSSVSRYVYTGKGLMRKVTTSFTDGRDVTSYLFYTEMNNLEYIITLSNNKNELNAKECSDLLKEVKSQDDWNVLNRDQDSNKVLFFAAYQYDAKGRVTSCTSFDAMAHRSHLTVDSVHYNSHNLPDTIDSYLYKRKDEYGSRIAFIYNKQAQIVETIENSNKQWFRNFKSEVAHLEYNSFLYNSQGHIITVEKRFAQQPDIRTRYEYEIK
ncbi:MAG TPA: hypothetical protein VL098_02600 [Flavipsychrobacter sp.]|nr:hypothetical protein [Flavipsychrobacter sp.]